MTCHCLESGRFAKKTRTEGAVSKFNIVIRDITRQQKQYKNKISSIKFAKKHRQNGKYQT